MSESDDSMGARIRKQMSKSLPAGLTLPDDESRKVSKMPHHIPYTTTRCVPPPVDPEITDEQIRDWLYKGYPDNGPSNFVCAEPAERERRRYSGLLDHFCECAPSYMMHNGRALMFSDEINWLILGALTGDPADAVIKRVLDRAVEAMREEGG